MKVINTTFKNTLKFKKLFHLIYNGDLQDFTNTNQQTFKDPQILKYPKHSYKFLNRVFSHSANTGCNT